MDSRLVQSVQRLSVADRGSERLRTMSRDAQLERQSLKSASVVPGVVSPKVVSCLAPYMSSWWTWSLTLPLLSQHGRPRMDWLTALSGGPSGRVADGSAQRELGAIDKQRACAD